LVVTVAEGVPAFDTAPGCRAAAQAAPEGFNACMKDEQARASRSHRNGEVRGVRPGDLHAE